MWIDLVAQDRETGGYCAIQCKFYEPHHRRVHNHQAHRSGDSDQLLIRRSRRRPCGRLLPRWPRSSSGVSSPGEACPG
ncbi:restriction endonuclease [Micromonospora tarensis]